MVLQEMDRAIIQGCLQAAEGGKLVQSIDGLHEFLVQHGLAWRQVIHCDHVGVHSQNRDGLGCSSAHVHDLLKSICSIGFSQSEVRGICLEVPHGPEGDEIRGFNQRLVSDAGGKLAPVTSLRYASVVGSHANQAARCIWHKVAHDDDRLTVDGKLSLEKLEAVDKAWARSIRDGHTWQVVSHELAREFPQYCLLAQAAGNAAGQIAAVEHEIQLAKRVNSSIQAFLSRSEKKTVTYQDISAEILRSRSPHASALPSIFGFVLKYGGGTEHDSFMARTERHVRAHGFPNRVLGGDMWHALSQDCKGPEQHVSWRHMLLKFGLCGPEKCLTLTDVKRSLSARDVLKSVGEAESFLLQVQKLGQDLDSDTIEASLGNLEVQLASIVLQKKKISQHDTLQDAARSCLEKSLRVYDETGKLVSNSRVVDLGFQPGNEVIRKADDMKGTIMEISAENVRLRLTDGQEYLASSQSFVDGKWKQHVQKAEPVLFKDWRKYDPVHSAEFTIGVVKGVVFRSMYEQYETLKVDDLDIFLKPSKNVQVKKSYNINILKLPIATARVNVGETVPAGAVQLAVLAAGATNKETHKIYMQAHFQGPKTDSSQQGFINPVWLMKSTTDRDEANMELHWTSKTSMNQKLTCKSASMTLPIVRNFVKLDAGDSLVLWRPDMGKSESIEVLEPVKKKVSRALLAAYIAAGLSSLIYIMSDEELHHVVQDEEEGDKPLKMFTAVCLSGGNIKGVWMPETQTVSGFTFIRLSKWCKKLTQYVTGKAMNLHQQRPINSINVQWFITMQELRRQACNEALKRVIVQAAEAEGSKIPEKIRPARQEDEFIAGRTVIVTPPAIEGSDDEAVAPQQLRLLWVLKSAEIWVELTIPNMEYVKRAILKSPPWQQPIGKRAKGAAASPKRRRRRGPKPRAHREPDEPLEQSDHDEAEDNREALDDD
ncbi:hypothetical protein AK812_SmicGene17089 [Symbiodinium microadriaticum]|uniref:Uncharacterized protein n=1 Tax=Symbiodinium microadriaticum TaxID=2951 RepID=A0A1Q9DYQ2_SYMMI|nr:hypothetical protein AK812_SmicGene17089 [Symbiodinium microadriaticum]